MDELDRAIQSIVDGITGDNLVSAIDAAGHEIYSEIYPRAKGTIQNALSVKSFPTRLGAMTTIQVDDSAPGGQEHHAVFVEFGTSKMAAESFMRSGFEASRQKAINVFANALASNVEKS